MLRLLAKPLVRFDTIRQAIAAEPTGVQCLENKQVSVELQYNPLASKRGGFKMAFKGSTDPPLFESGATVSVKQAYYFDHNSDKTKASSVKVFEGPAQATRLVMECQCLVYATTLFNETVAWIAKQEEHFGPLPPSLVVPSMRFVKAYYAYEPGAESPLQTRHFLIEEFIDCEESAEGSFTKYINNNSAKPTDMQDMNHIVRGKYLAFTQHVQYYLTDGQAYVTDYQGARCQQYTWLAVNLMQYSEQVECR